MQLSHLKPTHPRKKARRIGRGGKRGTTSGAGTKGQKSRAGASVRPGFRGGDNRIWQLFPKQRGASKKHGSKRPHRKHRFFAVSYKKPQSINVRDLAVFKDGETVSPLTLAQHGMIDTEHTPVKILGSGELRRNLSFQDVPVSAAAREKIEAAGGSIS